MTAPYLPSVPGSLKLGFLFRVLSSSLPVSGVTLRSVPATPLGNAALGLRFQHPNDRSHRIDLV